MGAVIMKHPTVEIPKLKLNDIKSLNIIKEKESTFR